MGFFALANIAPFAALRFTGQAGNPANLCCPPYHAIPPGGQALLYGISPYNAVRLELPRGDEDPAATREAWLRGGILGRDETPALYVYRRAWDSYAIDGIFACISFSGTAPPFSDPITVDRRRLLEAAQCQAGAVGCAYRDGGGVTAARLAPCFEAGPLLSFDLYHVTHTLWRLEDASAIEGLQTDFAARDLAVADRHLYEAAKASGSCIALLVGDTQPLPGKAHKYQPLTGLVMYDLC
jgi:uncharacterized protein (DUF1015 family)